MLTCNEIFNPLSPNYIEFDVRECTECGGVMDWCDFDHIYYCPEKC